MRSNQLVVTEEGSDWCKPPISTIGEDKTATDCSFGTLCLVDHVSVVAVPLAMNLVSAESLLISLPNDNPFVRIKYLWDEVQRKMYQISLPLFGFVLTHKSLSSRWKKHYATPTAWHLLLMLVTSLVTCGHGMASHSTAWICHELAKRGCVGNSSMSELIPKAFSYETPEWLRGSKNVTRANVPIVRSSLWNYRIIEWTSHTWTQTKHWRRDPAKILSHCVLLAAVSSSSPVWGMDDHHMCDPTERE